MSEIVNLNKARKRLVKQTRLKSAGENRIKFGLTRHVRDAARREQEKQAHQVDGARLEPEPDQKS